jgi:uncharacterized protein YjbI with pentapeptide repeats
MNCGDYVQARTLLNRYGCCPSDPTDMSQYVKFSDLSGITSATWSFYPATQDVSFGCNSLRNVSGIYFCDGTNISQYVTFSDLSDISSSPSAWSTYPATQDVSFGCNRLLSVSGIYFCDGTYIGHGASFDISTTQHVDIFSPTLRITASTINALNSTVIAQEISGTTLRGSTIIAQEISGATLRGSTVIAQEISGATLRGSTIIAQEISGATLRGSTVIAQDVSSATIRGSTIIAQEISGTTLRGSTVIAQEISGTTLRGSTVIAQEISGATLRGSTVIAQEISGTTLRGSTIIAQDVSSATIRGSTVIAQEISGTTLRGSTVIAQDVSSATIHTAAVTAPLVNGGIPYTTVYPPPYTVTFLPSQPHNGILYVDLSFGDDASANATGRYLYSYKTFAAALAAAVPGDTLYLLPGTYTLAAGVILPNNISIRGLNVQTTTITATPTVSTTLLTIGQNTRIEDITLTLTSATPNITLVALDFSGSSTTSKLRNAVVNVTSSDTSSNVIGVRSSGTTSTVYSPSDAIRSCTINVNSVGSTFVRGIYVTGANRFSVRDINIYADGLGNNSIGCEIVNASGILYIRNSSVYGVKADISRPIGTLYVGATELVNSNANGYDFDTILSPINVIYGTRGNLGTGTYYLLPGTYAESDILDPSNAFRMPNQACIHGMAVIVQKGITGAGGTFTLRKNGVDISGFTVTLPTNFTAGTYDSGNVSASFAKGDRVAIKAVLASNWNGGQHPIVDLSIY